jgi:hypothetical protein
VTFGFVDRRLLGCNPADRARNGGNGSACAGGCAGIRARCARIRSAGAASGSRQMRGDRIRPAEHPGPARQRGRPKSPSARVGAAARVPSRPSAPPVEAQARLGYGRDRRRSRRAQPPSRTARARYPCATGQHPLAVVSLTTSRTLGRSSRDIDVGGGEARVELSQPVRPVRISLTAAPAIRVAIRSRRCSQLSRSMPRTLAIDP